ncbi:hypothetical protein P4O66_022956 [Electrophorus voltai]|uniref:Uncharacterized protein n=1 Tax=Electrophorus voltai TaxID=2609070 RepID=A0AAD8ZNE7_9TELE|nr:hypothetical protein P4O66_022956 [Electrophorus voltai]
MSPKREARLPGNFDGEAGVVRGGEIPAGSFTIALSQATMLSCPLLPSSHPGAYGSGGLELHRLRTGMRSGSDAAALAVDTHSTPALRGAPNRMALIEFVFILVGVCAVFFCGIRLMRMLMVLFPKFWYPLPENFFTSMGKWAVITGGSEGIGHAYALQLARHGLNVVLISRSREKLEKAARNIERSTGRKVKLISADFTKDNIYGHIQESLRGLDVAVLVNNVGILPSEIPCKFLETTYLEEKIHQVINCNVKTMAKVSIKHSADVPHRAPWNGGKVRALCVSPPLLRAVGWGGGQFHSLSVSPEDEASSSTCPPASPKSPFPCTLYTSQQRTPGRSALLTFAQLYVLIQQCRDCRAHPNVSQSKVFIERFSQGLQAEYKSKRILVQTVSPFGVSTSMMGYQKEDLITFTAEAFVTSSLAYLKAGDQTYGSVRHAILGFFFQNIPKWVLTSEAFQHSFQEFVKKRVGA